MANEVFLSVGAYRLNSLSWTVSSLFPSATALRYLGELCASLFPVMSVSIQTPFLYCPCQTHERKKVALSSMCRSDIRPVASNPVGRFRGNIIRVRSDCVPFALVQHSSLQSSMCNLMRREDIGGIPDSITAYSHYLKFISSPRR
jgi:hypothetical protein